MTPKDRIQKAVEKFITKTIPQKPRNKRNQKPEKELEREAMQWLKAHGFDITVVESKATFNRQAGRYINQSIAPGTCDLVGNDSQGRAVFIELKAPGRRNTLREQQRDFLHRKILSGCFAVVIDSVKDLETVYKNWCNHEPSTRASFLLDQLPKKKAPKSTPQKNQDLPW